MSDFRRTKAALRSFDAKRSRINNQWSNAYSTRDVNAAAAEEKAAVEEVAKAFVDDTKRINQRATAMLVHPDDPWLRNLVKGEDNT